MEHVDIPVWPACCSVCLRSQFRADSDGKAPLPPLRVAAHTRIDGHVAAGVAGAERDRTGLMLWKGCCALLAFIAQEHVLRALRRCRVLELGAGGGAVSALCARAGVRVVCTDGSDSALELAQRTLEGSAASCEDFSVRRYAWGELAPPRETDPVHAELCSDVSNISVILASEVVYPSSTFAALRDLFARVRDILSSAAARKGQPDLGAVLPVPCMCMSYVQRSPFTTLQLAVALALEDLRAETHTCVCDDTDTCVLTITFPHRCDVRLTSGPDAEPALVLPYPAGTSSASTNTLTRTHEAAELLRLLEAHESSRNELHSDVLRWLHDLAAARPGPSAASLSSRLRPFPHVLRRCTDLVRARNEAELEAAEFVLPFVE